MVVGLALGGALASAGAAYATKCEPDRWELTLASVSVDCGSADTGVPCGEADIEWADQGHFLERAHGESTLYATETPESGSSLDAGMLLQAVDR